MKKAVRSIFLTASICLLVVLSAAVFVACDKGGRPTNSEFAFANGTTVADVLSMFDNGKIKSCTLQVKEEFGGVKEVSTVKCTDKIWYSLGSYGKEEWNIYDFADKKLYEIIPESGKVEYNWYELKDGESPLANMKSSLEDVSKMSTIVTTIIDSKSITITIAKGNINVNYVWSDFNCTNALLPLEYADFKAQAKHAAK